MSTTLSAAQKSVDTWQALARETTDLTELADLTDETDTAAVAELTHAVDSLAARTAEAELTLYLTGEHDSGSAILTLHAGAGGVDAADWTAMLLRMYTRYAERVGLTARLIDRSDHTEAGLKSATLEIRGENAYGFLRGEHGAHRLVRRSPFNSAGSRETSFAQVEVLPLIESDTEVSLDPRDLRIDTYAAGGAGGQHVNRTESAVRITHLPTGLTASCQSERSQHQNKAAALAVLRGRLSQQKEAATAAQLAASAGGRVSADFGGDAIRSYILDDRRVKDRRTGYETTNPEAVLDGDLTPLIRAYLTRKK